MAFYKANDKYSAVLSSGFTAGQTTLSVSAVPANVPTIVVVAKGTDKEAIFTVTGKTINSLTGVAWLKGYTGNLDAQMPVACLNNEEFINQYSAAVSTPESLVQILYGIDGGSTDTYAVALNVAPTEYQEGMLVAFKANTTNTGAATLNLNSLGAKSIKKNGNVELQDGDIQSGQVCLVVYDGTNFQLAGLLPPFTSPKILVSINDQNGNELLKVTPIADAVNQFELKNSNANVQPELFVSGGDTTIIPRLYGKNGGISVDGLYDNGTQGGAYAIDWSKGDFQKVTISSNITLSYSNARAGQRLTLLLIENGTGGYTITLPSGATYKFPFGVVPPFVTTANAKNMIVVAFDGTDYMTQGACDLKAP